MKNETADKTRLISIIIPVFNEQDNIYPAYKAICDELNKRDNIKLEFIFTDNHSTDNTFPILEKLAAEDSRVRVIRFTRNYGFNKSILTGYRYARGEAAIQIDCDLEDPPSVFHQFIEKWISGHDVVTGVRENRVESRFRKFARASFFRLINAISDTKQEPNTGDFRLVDRSILDELKLIEDAQPYVRGLIIELSRNEGRVVYSRDSRQHGESKFPFRQLVKLGLDGIYAHSTIPLKLATYIGIAVAVITAVLSCIYIIGRLLFPENWPQGFATTTVLILFGISLNALFLGIIGEYIARIYQQIRKRPTVIIEKILNKLSPPDIQK